MDSVKLMNRIESKYTFPSNQLPIILEKIKPFYRILEIDGKRLHRYNTVYFDTENLAIYNKHQSGSLNRYKIRHRTYKETENSFLEVKFKSNKGVTFKNRIPLKLKPAKWCDRSSEFIVNNSPYDPSTLFPKIEVNFSRITFVSFQCQERLTFDLGLEFKNGTAVTNLPKLITAELKQVKKNTSPFKDVMKRIHIREGSLSKYCIGIALNYKKAKINNFKSKLKTIKNKSK